MAARAVDEALRNVICVGTDPSRVAILDNFCWPKADTEESLGALVRTCKGASDVAFAYGLPFISGKDSLNNQFSMTQGEAQRTGLPQQMAIPPTLLISAIGIVEDVGRCVTMDFKEAGNAIVLARHGGGIAGAGAAEAGCEPGFDIAATYQVHRRVAELIATGQVVAAHDVSDGGLAVALAEMCIASGLGATIDLSSAAIPLDLWKEPVATYVLEMPAKAAACSGWTIIGTVSAESMLRITRGPGEKIEIAVGELDAAWRSPLTQGDGRP
jgi:phosphoribosylformylglycinamidine synthase